MNEERQYKYHAFISYRHAEPDRTVAKRLQELLERYVLPCSAQGARQQRIRLFRDEDELQTSSDLSDEIKEALASSEYLIVICSPNLAESTWCAEEIRIFKELHDGATDHIIAAVADGEVSEVLPEALTRSMRRVTDADGTERVEEVRVEPLAANFAADTAAERKKKLKKEFLRVAAPLLHTPYPALYDRHQKRRTKKLMTAGAVILAAVGVFAVTVTTMLVRIRKQNTQLVEQQEQLEEQNRLVEERNELLEEQTVALSRSRSDLLAEQSLQVLQNDDRSKAIELALEALPEKEDPSLVTPKTEYALVQALSAYQMDERRALPRAAKTYTMPDLIRDGCADSFFHHKYLALVDQSDQITVWDTETETVSCSVSLAGRSLRNPMLSGSGRLFVICTWEKTSVLCYDCKTGEPLWELDSFEDGNRSYDYFREVACLSEDGKLLAVFVRSQVKSATIPLTEEGPEWKWNEETEQRDDVLILDAETGDVISVLSGVTSDVIYDKGDSLSGASVEQMIFSKDAKKLAVASYGYDRGGVGRYGLHYGNIDTWLSVYDLESGEKTAIGEQVYLLDDFCFSQDGELLALYRKEKKDYSIRNIYETRIDHLFDGTTIVCAFDAETGKRNWKHELRSWSLGRSGIASGMDVTGQDGKVHPAAVCYAGNVVDVVDTESGALLYHFECGAGVLEVAWEALAPDRKGLHAILENGNLARLIFEEDVDYSDESYIREYPVFPRYIDAAIWLNERIYILATQEAGISRGNSLLCYDWGQSDSTMRKTELSEEEAFDYLWDLYPTQDGFYFDYYEGNGENRTRVGTLLDAETGEVRYRRELGRDALSERLLGQTPDGSRMVYGRTSGIGKTMELLLVRISDGETEVQTITDEEICEHVYYFGNETVLSGNAVLFFYQRLEVQKNMTTGAEQKTEEHAPIPLIPVPDTNDSSKTADEMIKDMAVKSPYYTGEREICICAYDLESGEITREAYVVPELTYQLQRPVPDPSGRYLAFDISSATEDDYDLYNYVLLDRETGEITPFPYPVSKNWSGNSNSDAVLWNEDGTLLLTRTEGQKLVVYHRDLTVCCEISTKDQDIMGAFFHEGQLLAVGNREGNTAFLRYSLSDGSLLGQTVLKENEKVTTGAIHFYPRMDQRIVIQVFLECYSLDTSEWMMTAHLPDAIGYLPEKEVFMMRNACLIPYHTVWELKKMAEEMQEQ